MSLLHLSRRLAQLERIRTRGEPIGRLFVIWRDPSGRLQPHSEYHGEQGTEDVLQDAAATPRSLTVILKRPAAA
ncbi:hypothetical protein BH23GEM7_BH23GEM7_05090 [soil metagenome]|jgi:hypothetical protein|nr:hypothetical protein [Gemmatimonadota bacterium]